MKKYLYIMRHGETVFNVRKKIQGHCDSPLTERGIKQAHIAAEYFMKNPVLFDHAYSSTAERASDTIEIVLRNKMPYKRVKELKELNFGIFEGESEMLNPKGDYGDFFLQYGGESNSQGQDRIVKAITGIMDKEDHENVFVVSHSGVSGLFYRSCRKQLSSYEKAFLNCSIVKYEYDGKEFTPLEIIAHDYSSI